ncbi:hypothetical protein JHK84_043647 [Glycine max]|nr:hypothetical protein JHK86_043459 [Glycine max]KAG5117534.1 hypothetical protein JHK84_043647 [Glycine max]
MDFVVLLHIFVFSPILFCITFLSLLLPNPTYFWAWKSQLSQPVADLVLRNGVIYTSDDSLPFADSMAVANGRVLRVGNRSFFQELEGYGTQVLDLGGKVVVPGFLDSHVHFIDGGLQMMQVKLRGVNKKEEFIRRIKDAAQSTKQGSWILGGGWNNDLWGGDLPAASWIDDVTPNNPVWLSRVDGHTGLVNSVALVLAGITNLTDDPRGGTILRTANGEPPGVLIDSARTLVASKIPEDSVDDRREALLRASNLALTRGVTMILDMGRYYRGFSTELSWDDFSGGVKAFSDGSLGSNSALLYEIEHAQQLASGTRSRFGKQRVVASMQPDQLLDDADSTSKKLGKDRAEKESYLFRSLLNNNALVAFGSDWPVVDINPLSGIKTAMKRRPPNWQSAWIPSECISLDDAIKCDYMFHAQLLHMIFLVSLLLYTISAARASFLDKDLGSLSPGKLADFVILSTDSWKDFAEDASAYMLC